MWLDLGLGVFWRKRENSLLNVEEFLGGSVTSRAKARVGWEIRKRKESLLIKSEW